MRSRHVPPALLSVLVLGLASCGDDSATADPTTATSPPATAADTTTATTPVIDPGDGGEYDPAIDPAAFVDGIDHPYLPLAVGARWVYEGVADGEVERTEVVVTDEQREVMGIAATVVRDTVTVDGVLVEDTFDWFAQDADGNVWYLGEEVENYEDGVLVDTDGSWEAGVDGALPGIVMPADPAVGVAYRQEYWAGEAEDLGEVVAVGGTVSVPAGEFTDVLTTRDWNPLEPDVVEEKQYVPGVGLVREEQVVGGEEVAELLEFVPGS